MKYKNVYLSGFGYHLPELRISTRELEERLSPVYKKLRIAVGQLEAMTGIKERRWWNKGYQMASGAIEAGERALRAGGFEGSDIDALVYGGVCRDYYEPATACSVGAALGLRSDAIAYDLSNACLGVMNGIVDIANRIELGQIETGMVVSCESSRDVTEDIINQLLENPNMGLFKDSIATLTGGSGAAAVILTKNGSPRHKHRLVGGVSHSSLSHHNLCRWGVRKKERSSTDLEQFTITDAVGVLKHGLDLGAKTFAALLGELGWAREQVDKVISHQVGKTHRLSILKKLGIPEERDYRTFDYFGNVGTVSLPLSAALAAEQSFLKSGDQVGFLGIGSGLNCLMLGVDW